MVRINKINEKRCLDLVSKVLDCIYILGKRFDFLRGDPTPKRNSGVTLPVDGFFPKYNLVVEYRGKQHFHPNKLMDRRKGRASQRRKYDKRREEVLPNHGFKLLIFRHDENINDWLVRKRLKEVGLL